MGTLYIVSTPIGNLKDITLRAIETLKSIDFIVCEDTRVTARLLNEYQIDKKMVSMTDFNEASKASQIISELASGKTIALVSDAGTPLVSDPGFKLVRETIVAGIKVEAIAGPSAAIAALTVSGLPTDKFLFIGYLSKKDGKRKRQLEDIKSILSTIKSSIIIYESPYRVLKTLSDIKNIFGEIDIVICRELTKLHEEIRREKISNTIEHFQKATPKGEFVLLF